MAKTISKGKSASSRARAIRSSRMLAAQGGATALAPDRDAEGQDATELDERDDAQDMGGASDDEQDELSYAGDDEPDSADAVDADDRDDEDTEDARALALPDRAEQADRATTQHYQRGGVYVPEFLMGNPATRWLAEAYVELRKVTWPTRHAAWNMTLVVVVVALLAAAVLGAADFGLTRLVTWLSSLSAG